MTALVEVARYIPDTSTRIEDLADELGITPFDLQVFHRHFDLQRVRLAPELDLRGLMVRAAGALAGLRGNEGRVRYVIAGRTLATTGPSARNALHEACAELGLGDAISLTVHQHACASGLLAVDTAGQLLSADGEEGALALVLTGEKATIPGSRMIAGTTVMGESSAACLVRAGGGRGELLSYSAHTHGEYHQVFPPKELSDRFGREYSAMLIGVIQQAVDGAGIGCADLALILPHNVNRFSWSRVCQLLGFPLDRVHLDNMPELGHSFCADAFVNYVDAVDQGRLSPGDHYLMVGVGLGATFSAMVFRH